MEREWGGKSRKLESARVVATCLPQGKKSKWTQQQRALHTFSLKEKASENGMKWTPVGAGKSRDFVLLCCRCRCCCSCSARVAAYFNQCTTTMIFIFMRQRNDLVSTYLNLHFNCLAHFMSHSSSRAKSADARARALRCALSRNEKKLKRAREWERECARVRVGVEFCFVFCFFFCTEQASLWLFYTHTH